MLEKTYTIKIYETRAQMGAAAAEATSALIRSLLAQKESIRMIFAAAPSQSDFLAALTADERVDFSRIHAFHMDEYIGLSPDAPQGFGNFLRRELFSKVPFASVSYLDGCAIDKAAECRRYGALLAAAHHVCIVPTSRKAAAVRNAVCGALTEACPASALRTCRDMVLYLDKESAGALSL